jgi:cytochrome b involved in lipid metabolism
MKQQLCCDLAIAGIACEAIDVTKFIPLHPGGEDMMMAYLGKDATEDWQAIHAPDTLEKYVQFLGKMGKIKADRPLLSWIWKKLSKRDGTAPELQVEEPTKKGGGNRGSGSGACAVER